MAKTTRLSDLQLILMSNALQRDDGSLLPFPENPSLAPARIAAAIPPLLKRGLITEAPVTDRSLAWRDDDQQTIGLFLAEAARTLIAADAPDDLPESAVVNSTPEAGADPSLSPVSVSPARAGTKVELVLGLLRRPEGATMAELVAATSWLPHTTRAALTGLRKIGHGIARDRRDDQTCYRIAEAA